MPIVYIRNVLHLLNYLGYYAAFVCKNLYFFGSFFFSIRIFSFVIVIHSYCKTTWLIVSLNIQIYWLIILSIPLLEKNPSGFFNFRSIWRLKTLSFRSLKNSLNSQFLGVILTAWRCLFDVVLSQIKKTDEQNLSFFDLCRLINNKIK